MKDETPDRVANLVGREHRTVQHRIGQFHALHKVLHRPCEAAFGRMELQQAATSAKVFADNLNQASDQLKRSDNVIGVMLRDPKAAAKLQSTIDNLQKGSVLLNEDLEAAQSNFLLKGFFNKRAKAKADSIKNAQKK